MGEVDNTRLENWFTYHAPTADQIVQYQEIRELAKGLAYAIVRNIPASADQTAALRKLRECVMTANAATARNGQ